MEHQTRHLWGREFDIVERGLNEEQVIAYIEELRQKSAKIQDQDSRIEALKRLAESTLAEADRIAHDIRKEAKAKAVEIIDEAEEKLQQALEVRKKLESDARAKAVEILAEAEKKRQVIEEKAQAILEAASEQAATIKSQHHPSPTKPLSPSTEQSSDKVQKDIRTAHQKLITDLVTLAAKIRILEAKMEGFKMDHFEKMPAMPQSDVLDASRELDSPLDIEQYLEEVQREVSAILSGKLQQYAIVQKSASEMKPELPPSPNDDVTVQTDAADVESQGTIEGNQTEIEAIKDLRRSLADQKALLQKGGTPEGLSPKGTPGAKRAGLRRGLTRPFGFVKGRQSHKEGEQKEPPAE